MTDYQQELTERAVDALELLARAVDNYNPPSPHEPTVEEVHDNAWNGLYAIAKSIEKLAEATQNVACMIDIMQRNPVFRHDR